MRLIDADALIEAIRHDVDQTQNSDWGYGLNHAIPIVRSQPTIDALALLKEQEAVKPTLIREGFNKYYDDYVCPRCDNEVVYEQNYCSECGVKFIWEGR